MLVLTRKLGEVICIGEDASIKIQILNIRNNHVKIGITALPEVPIHREEIYNKIQLENKKQFPQGEEV